MGIMQAIANMFASSSGQQPAALLDQDFSQVVTQYGIGNATTIAALRLCTVSASSLPGQVYVQGYYADNDGGGGVFVIDPSDTTSNDNGGTIIVDAKGNRWKRPAFIPLNNKMFGAVVDGVTNDTSANQALINWVGNNGGGTANFVAGTTVSDGLTFPFNVVVQGAALSIGYPEGVNGTATILKSAGTSARWVISPAVAGQNGCCGVVGMVIKGVGAGHVQGGLQLNVNNGRFQWLMFDNFGEEGAGPGTGAGGSACLIADILAFNCLRNHQAGGTPLTGFLGVITVGGTDQYIANVEANGSQSGVIDGTNFYNVGLYITGANHFARDCVGEFADVGIVSQAAGAPNVLTGCRADHNFGHGFYEYGFSMLIGCKANDNSRGGDGLYDAFHNNTRQASLLVGCLASVSDATKRHNYGFYDATGFSTASGSNVYRSCVSSGHVTATAHFTNFFVRPSFDLPNLIIRSTGDNPNVDGSLFYAPNDSSAQNLTQMQNVVPGNTYTIRGNSNITIKHNATPTTGAAFLNASGADRVLANNQIYAYACIANAANNAYVLVQVT